MEKNTSTKNEEEYEAEESVYMKDVPDKERKKRLIGDEGGAR